MTVIWSQKPSYEDDKENIIRLSSDKDMVGNTIKIISNFPMEFWNKNNHLRLVQNRKHVR